jgi:hypothetical protein
VASNPRDSSWAGPGTPRRDASETRTPDFGRNLAGRGGTGHQEEVLTAGLSSDTPRRHSTSPLSLTAQSAMLCPHSSVSGLSGMMDTSPRAMGATSSQGPLVTSLHFLCRKRTEAKGASMTARVRACHHSQPPGAGSKRGKPARARGGGWGGLGGQCTQGAGARGPLCPHPSPIPADLPPLRCCQGHFLFVLENKLQKPERGEPAGISWADIYFDSGLLPPCLSLWDWRLEAHRSDPRET